MNEKEKDVLIRFEKWIYENNPSKEFLVEIIKLGFDYGNGKTISQHSKEIGMTYQGFTKCHNNKISNINGIKFVLSEN